MFCNYPIFYSPRKRVMEESLDVRARTTETGLRREEKIVWFAFHDAANRISCWLYLLTYSCTALTYVWQTSMYIYIYEWSSRIVSIGKYRRVEREKKWKNERVDYVVFLITRRASLLTLTFNIRYISSKTVR